MPLSSHATAIDDTILDEVFAALGADDDYLDEIDARAASPFQSTDADHTPWILHIEDDAEMRDVVKLRLEANGIAVCHANDGTSGFRKALVNPASAIILDYEMPNGLGDYVLRRLKETPLTRSIPVVILTGTKDKFLERRLINMGAAAFFNKPPQFESLIAELNKHIKIREALTA